MALQFPAHVLLQMSGTVGSPTSPLEVWSTSLRIRTQPLTIGDPNASYDETVDYLDDKIDNITDWFQDPDTGISSNCALTQVKLNAINPTGHYRYAQTNVKNISAVQGGVTPTHTTPLQVAMVASLVTQYSRGYASKGRMYLPVPALALNSNYVWNIGDVAEVAAVTAGLMATLRDTTGILGPLEWRPAVVSGLDGGSWNEVTAVAVDTKPDTQRRRANAIAGAKAISTLS